MKIYKPIIKYIQEPKLTFGFNQMSIDPKEGLILFGPFSNKSILGPKNVGIIGPAYLREKMKIYLKKIHSNVINPEKEIARPDFPGLEAVFGISINFSCISEIDIKIEDIDKHLHNKDSYQRVYNLVDIYISRIIQYTKQEEIPNDIWFIVIPEKIYLYGRPNSRIPPSISNFLNGLSKRERESEQLNLFYQNEINKLKLAYQYEVNFHNQLKARLLQSKIITQIIRESKIAYDDYFSKEEADEERKFDTNKAWNISTSLYYKLGGLPWKLGDIRKGVCYLGLIFKKIDGDERNQNACCAAQMFLDNGDGMVFRGNIGPWWNVNNKEFHLDRKDAFELLSKSLSSYYDRFQCYPNEVFIHARTFFNLTEWTGFEEAAKGKSNIIGIRINDHPVFKLYRQERYAVVRGTMLQYDEKKAFLWTKGFIPKLGTQLGLETPNPLDIVITYGESDITIVCTDILSLSKLNYNTCLYGDGLPVTLKFANLIGDILTAGKDIQTGVLTFKHYI